MTKPADNTAVIVTPRGKNVGANIKNELVNKGIWSFVNLDTINTVRDAANKQLVTTIQYSY